MKSLILAILLLTQIEAQVNDSTQVAFQRKILIGLTCADMMTTAYGLSTGGRELNPLLPQDIRGIVAINIIGSIWYLSTEPSKKELWLVNIITSMVVTSNINQIIRHSRGK